MSEQEKAYWETQKEKLIEQPWSDDGSDAEWDKETRKNWEDKMKQ